MKQLLKSVIKNSTLIIKSSSFIKNFKYYEFFLEGVDLNVTDTLFFFNHSIYGHPEFVFFMNLIASKVSISTIAVLGYELSLVSFDSISVFLKFEIKNLVQINNVLLQNLYLAVVFNKEYILPVKEFFFSNDSLERLINL